MAQNDPSELGKFERIVENVASMRSELFKQIMDPRRELEDECGYPKGIVDSIFYQNLFDKQEIAARVVQVLPYACWQVQPTVYEKESGETVTEFEDIWRNLGKQIRCEKSYFQDEEGSPVWEYLRRADELSGIGQFGIIFLGLNDGLPPDQPVRGFNDDKLLNYPSEIAGAGTDAEYFRPLVRGRPTSRKGKRGDLDLLFLRVFPESLVQITQFESRLDSPRFGQPVMYQVTLNDPRQIHSGIGLSLATINVHWTRVVHIADNLMSSEVFGIPRMRPVLHRLLDLQKLYGGSAEMYWKGALPGWALETQPSLGPDVKIDKEAVRDMMEDYMNGLQRYLALMGLTAKSLAPQVVDPSPQIAVQIEAICIKLGVPKRVFMGSERGELASSQDDAAWNDQVRDRQRNYLTPRLIVPFVDRLINIGVLPEVEGYSVWWPDLTSQTSQERASIGLTKTQALAQYHQSGVAELITEVDYFTLMLGMPEQEAITVHKNAEANKKKMKEEAMKEQLEMQKLGLPGPLGAPTPPNDEGKPGGGIADPTDKISPKKPVKRLEPEKVAKEVK